MIMCHDYVIKCVMTTFNKNTKLHWQEATHISSQYGKYQQLLTCINISFSFSSNTELGTRSSYELLAEQHFQFTTFTS